MSHVKLPPHNRPQLGRKSSAECGAITEQDGEIKVKWDDGRTSYFRHGREADVQLEKRR